jgi:hypothetical protein
LQKSRIMTTYSVLMIDLGLAYCFREEILGPELKRFIERAEKPEETK